MNATTLALSSQDKLHEPLPRGFEPVQPQPAPAPKPSTSMALSDGAAPLSVVLVDCSAETICQRANAVTRVLSEILSYRGGFPHGGINE